MTEIGAQGFRPSNWRFLPDYKPSILYLGVELEVDNFPAPARSSDHLGLFPNYPREFYMKSDPSIHSGIELVSHPATLEYHENQFGWANILEVIREEEGKGRPNCGLHIHFSKSFFGEPAYTRNKCLLKVLYISKAYREPLYTFSRRAGREGWRQEGYGLLTTMGIRLTKVKDAEQATREAGRAHTFAIQSNIPTTVEVRLFNSTTDLQQFFGALELVAYIAFVAKTYRISDLYHMPWGQFIKGIDPDLYPFLQKELKSRKVT